MIAGASLLVSGGAASTLVWICTTAALQPYALCLVPEYLPDDSFWHPVGWSKSVDVEVKPDSYLSNLDFALMGTFEARKGDWALAMDLVYNDFSGQQGKIKTVQGPEGNESLPIDVNADMDIKALIWEGIGSYIVARSATGTLDMFGGVGYLGLKTPTGLDFSGPEGVLDLRATDPTRSTCGTGLSACVAQRSLAATILPYYLDIGGNYSNWTWWMDRGRLSARLGRCHAGVPQTSYSTTGNEASRICVWPAPRWALPSGW